MITSRPLDPADLGAVVGLLHAYDRRWFGEPLLSASELAATWGSGDVDPAVDGEAWLDGDTLVAFGTLDGRGAVELAVRDDWSGSGLDDALLRRWEDEAARRGHPTVRREIPAADNAARARLEARGWVVRRTGWLLDLAADVPTPDVPVPSGYDVRPLQEGDVRAAYDVLRAAFAVYGGPLREFEEWRTVRVDRPDVTLGHCRVAVRHDEVVGACIVEDPEDAYAPAWVSLVGVDLAHRRRGLAGALLSAVVAASRARGVARVALYTHEDTGARDLYERVGMVVRSTLLECELDLADRVGSGAR